MSDSSTQQLLEDGDSREPMSSRAMSPESGLTARNRVDIAVYVALAALGVLQIVLGRRVADFVGDVTYLELAKSIIGGTGYAYNLKPETMLPPGFPYLLALFTVFLGTSYAVLVRTMAVFTMLALVYSYEVLRSRVSRKVAAAICLLIASSPIIFRFSTTLVFSDLPYFFTSMMLLWGLTRLELASVRHLKRTLWWLLCFVLVVASVLLRSTGTALLGGILGWLTISAFTDRSSLKRRLQVFLPLVIVGMFAQMAWMHWAVNHQFSEWPVHGYQENYLSQLRVKNGNDPELGLATWKDVLERPFQNADDRGAELWALIARKPVAPAWYSPMSAVPIVLVLLGLGATLWESGGGISEWYFLCYEGMYLFWPWNFEERFFLPVAPLACLYLWRGVTVVSRLGKARPARVASIAIACAAAGIAGTEIWGRHFEHPQPRLCIAIWALIAVASAFFWIVGRMRTESFSIAMGRGNLSTWPAGVAVFVACMVAIGVRSQVRLGIENLHFRVEDDSFYPDREAAQWIKENTSPSAVVMARKDDIVYHYGRRRVIWFPPSSDANLLISGIRKYNVQYVVVVAGNDNYWSPPASDSFALLSKAYPNAFELVHQSANESVYQVSPDAAF
jgi:Dolichyl-phosphate-mannose-protein mannosyltransferase